MNQYNARIEAAVAKRLKFPISVIRWQRDKFGFQVPVVRVPAHLAEHAKALGLTVEVS